MKNSSDKNLGASPLPKGKQRPLFKKEAPAANKPARDKTGQTDTSLKDMKQRLAEVPKKSIGSKHDKAAYDEDK